MVDQEKAEKNRIAAELQAELYKHPLKAIRESLVAKSLAFGRSIVNKSYERQKNKTPQKKKFKKALTTQG